MIAPRLLEAIEDPELLGMELHPEQRALVEGFEGTPNAVVAAGRRGGKTLLGPRSAWSILSSART